MEIANPEGEIQIPTREFLEQLYRELPQAEADGAIGSSVKKFIATLPNLVYGGFRTVNYIQARDAIETLSKMVNSSSGEAKECLEKALKFHENSGLLAKAYQKLSGCPSTAEMLEKIKCAETNLDKLKADYSEGIKRMETKFANDLLTGCAISSAVVCLVEIVKLVNIWECIEEAENCIVGGEDRQKIVANLAILRITLEEVASLQVKFGENGRRAAERRDIMDEIDDRMPNIQQTIYTTRQLIGKVQINVNGKRERLAGHRKDLKVSAMGTGAQLALNIFQFGFALPAAGPLMISACAAALTAHLGVFGAQLYTNKVTKETIEKCRVAYAELDLLDQNVQQMQGQYNEIRLWVKRVLRRMKEEEDRDRMWTIFSIICAVLVAIGGNYFLHVFWY